MTAFLAADALAQEEVTIYPSKDNTLYSEGGVSNGAGEYLFVGRTGTNAPDGPLNRRAVLHFDVAGALPDDVRIEEVSLALTMSRAPFQGTETEMSVHRLTRDWGEGASDAGEPGGSGAPAEDGDATWTYAFFDTEEWENAGGDYATASSATFSFPPSPLGVVTVESTADLVADVQAWRDDPSTNFGWIIIGDETEQHTARRFDSREASETRRPQLTIQYTETTASEREDLPRSLVLDGNYPNPFAGSTTIRYELDKADEVTLKVFDVLGRPVLEVSQGLQPLGPHRIELSNSGLAAGTYIYCLEGKASARECRSLQVLR